MPHFKLFEEFTRQTGPPYIEKLRMFALASTVPTHVSEIKVDGIDSYFMIDTKIPGDGPPGAPGKPGTFQSFKVVIPMDKKIPYVDTYEGGEKIFHASIEATDDPNDNPFEIQIFVNYLEAAQLFDDNDEEYMTDIFNKATSVDYIKKVLKQGLVG